MSRSYNNNTKPSLLIFLLKSYISLFSMLVHVLITLFFLLVPVTYYSNVYSTVFPVRNVPVLLQQGFHLLPVLLQIIITCLDMLICLVSISTYVLAIITLYSGVIARQRRFKKILKKGYSDSCYLSIDFIHFDLVCCHIISYGN
uniref:Uncharacterized protein n=1 Tax=Heterorhabditis bacteriophora TaxID=37862 RepID=A0A1I7WXH4_HETBA